MKSIIVFHGEGSGFWPAFLGREGFRHCYVIVPAGDYWILLDGTAGAARLEVIGGTKDSAAASCLREGLTIVEFEARSRGLLVWPWMLMNCVGSVKAMLGVRAPWVLTPWQLYRHLQKPNVKERKGH